MPNNTDTTITELNLRNLKSYLINNGPTSLLKLSEFFNEPTDQIMNIAEHYIAKGFIHCDRTNAKCAKVCNSCFMSKIIKISWITR
jgi:hypothetical protein